MTRLNARDREPMLQSAIEGPWQRMAEPILSATTAGQDWCRVALYSPTVIRVGNRYRMWFAGCASHSRASDHCLGCAESDDGLHWRLYEGNPIATPLDIPWGMNWQTPEVLFDEQAHVYHMWFVSITRAEWEEIEDGQRRCVLMEQALGYARSEDGIDWDVHPTPVYPSGRSPSVLATPDGSYCMWMGSRPGPDDPWDSLYRNIYRFTSPDGIQWTRGEHPVVCPSGVAHSCVYPCVVRDGDGYLMLYGAHLQGGTFEIFSATSPDGLKWTCHYDRSILPASGIPGRFDGRYTSTPSLVCEPDRILLYYSGRPLENTYRDGQGRERIDTCGIYGGIGVAVCPVHQ